MVEIVKYENFHEEPLILLLKQERDWDEFTNAAMLETFKSTLMQSVSYVSFHDGVLCGYIRAIDDPFGVYISELYVGPTFRGRGCGTALLRTVKKKYSTRAVYVLSDEDEYYEKLGLDNVGTVFEVSLN